MLEHMKPRLYQASISEHLYLNMIEDLSFRYSETWADAFCQWNVFITAVMMATTEICEVLVVNIDM